MQADKLSINLPANMAQTIRRQVGEGGYASVGELVHGAMRIWLDRAQERERQLQFDRLNKQSGE